MDPIQATASAYAKTSSSFSRRGKPINAENWQLSIKQSSADNVIMLD